MNRNPDVDRWLDQAGRPLEAAMRRARDIILGADGRVTESIKWKTSTFAYRGNIASFNPSKHLLSIMFHRGSEIPGDHPRLEGEPLQAGLSGGVTAEPADQILTIGLSAIAGYGGRMAQDCGRPGGRGGTTGSCSACANACAMSSSRRP